MKELQGVDVAAHFTLHFSDGNIEDFFVAIFIDIVFLLQKQRVRGITFSKYDEKL